MKFKTLQSGAVFTQHDVKYIKIDTIEFPQTHGGWVEHNRPYTTYNAIDLNGTPCYMDDDDYCEFISDLCNELED